MNQTIVPNSGPKLRLVEAAEKLFAENGFEAVSVRDITKEAGANVAAVNYHFGSRDGLVVAVMSRYLTPVNQERLVRLDRAEKNTSEQAIEEILAAFVKPLVDQVGRSELSEKLYCKLAGRIYGEQAIALPTEIEYQTRNVIERFTRALQKLLPGFTGEELIWRLHFIAGGLIHLMTHTDFLYRVAGSLCGTPPMDLTITRFIQFSAAGLRDGVHEIDEASKPRTPQALFNF
jgi:AcrR family transcriptional regulator